MFFKLGLLSGLSWEVDSDLLLVLQTVYSKIVDILELVIDTDVSKTCFLNSNVMSVFNV